MTAHKHFKQLVRTRMSKTGESYSSARRQILNDDSATTKSPNAKWHLPGTIPATTALRVIVTAAGVVDPTTKKPFTEAMLFGIAGGIGAGVAQFFYAKENFASIFLAGRHAWHDDKAYLEGALTRFGFKPIVKESSGAKSAEKQLREMLVDGAPCIAWVDMAGLPHRALPAQFSGGGYHVVTVCSIDDESNTALIGDLGDGPVKIKLAEFSAARARIKKFKNRLLRIERCDKPFDLAMRIRSGLKACHAGLGGRPMKGYPSTFNLDAFANFAKRLHGSNDKDSWERVFKSGANLWRGLTSIHEYVEHYHTGGGLCRPMFAQFLAEASRAMNDPDLKTLSAHYEKLGKMWTEFADAALPQSVPLFKEARKLYARRAEAMSCGDTIELRTVWSERDALAKHASAEFPLSDDEADSLRLDLQKRMQRIHTEEAAARDVLGKSTG